MDPELVDLINTRADAIEEEIRRIGAREYLARWNQKTGRLFSSIDADVSIANGPGGLRVNGQCLAGLEGQLFYIWFLELGTGAHIQDKALARRPYGEYDEVDFNINRLDYPAGTGWLILSRIGLFPNKRHFAALGIPGKNWFAAWEKEAQNYLDTALAQLQAEIQFLFGE